MDMSKSPGTRMRAPAFAAALVTMALIAPSAHGQASPRAKAIGDRVMCMCGGCNEAAGKCTHSGGAFAGPCNTAKAELKEIDDHIAQGQSDDLILSEFVQEYGPTVLLSPPAKGFDVWAWVMPAVLPLFGLLLVWLVISRWRGRVAIAGGPEVPADLLARARNEMNGDEDD